MMKRIVIHLLFIYCAFGATAQVTSVALKQSVNSSTVIIKAGILFAPQLKQFYNKVNYTTVWIQAADTTNRNTILKLLQLTTALGLNERDYQFSFIETIRKNTAPLLNADDSIEAELRITDAALHFYNDLAYGNSKPDLGYNGLNYIPACYDIPVLLATYIANKELPLLIDKLMPGLGEISILKHKINWFQKVMQDTGFAEVTVNSSMVNKLNRALAVKLYQLGISDSLNFDLPDTMLKQQLKIAQRQFELLSDGTLRSTILQELNVPLSARLKQLIVSLNYYRWLSCITHGGEVIVVNLPAAYLKVYSGNAVVLEMRMVVGKKSTPTPTLTSKVDEVVLYPYWHVPQSIAVKELLPAIKRDPGFIDNGNYQVLNMAGKIMDPYAIKWHQYNAAYFPFLIRQSTGCDNALGLLKLDFYSPFGVYLHDTPNKFLFTTNKRFYSHGCMRMQKPMEIGHLLLKKNSIAIDTLEQKGCLRNQAPVTVPVNVHMPVIVWYNPAGADSTGSIRFYEDVYGRFKQDK